MGADSLANWNEADLLRLMRTGQRPDGTAVDPLMPWPVYSNMNETELRALWAHLRTIDPAPGRGDIAQR